MSAGLDPGQFWRLTIREIEAVLKGVGARLSREHDANAWLAWHIEALARVKKMPKLTDMQTSKPAKRRKMTPEEMISMAHLWTAATRH